MLAVELFEELEGPPEPTLIDALRDFLPLAVRHLKLKNLPKIKLLRDVDTEHLPSFGKFSNDDRIVHVDIQNRHPNDVLRTLAHELTHYAQGEQNRLDADSWRTGSTIEDEANAEAGVIMREFNKQFPQYMELKPIILPEGWSQKYKKSINCNNPKGFSQKAHCAGRKKNTNMAEGWFFKSPEEKVKKAQQQKLKGAKLKKETFDDLLTVMNKQIPELIEDINLNQFKDAGPTWFAIRTKVFSALMMDIVSDKDQELKRVSDKITEKLKFFGSVPNIFSLRSDKTLALRFNQQMMIDKEYIIKLLNQYLLLLKKEINVEKQGVAENFADGKGPGRSGDSQRHGIPKGATMAQLEKAARAPGRKGQLARWQINMRRGRKK